MDILINSFKIISNGEHTSMLMSVSDSSHNEIYISNLQNGNWSLAERYTDLGKYVRSFSPFMYDDGSIAIAASVAEINGINETTTGLYGNTSIMVLNQCEYFDIIASCLYFEDDEIMPNNNINLYFNVTNDSSEEITELKVKIDNNGKNIAEKTIPCNIAPYTTEELNVEYSLAESITKSNINLTVQSSKSEKDYSNNNLSAEIGKSNIKIDYTNCNVMKDNSAKIKALISNDGYDDAKNISIKLYDSNNHDKLLDEINIENLIPGEKYNFEYDYSSDLASTDNSDIINAVYMLIETESEELKYSDNEKKITFNNYSDSYDIVYDEITETGLKMNFTTKNSIDGNIFCAIYNSDESLIRCERKSTADIDENGSMSFTWNNAEAATVKIFVWDNEMISLCEAQPEFEIRSY